MHEEPETSPFDLQPGDDAHRVLERVDFVRLARASSHEQLLADAVRRAARDLDPELSELGDDPDRAVCQRAAALSSWRGSLFLHQITGKRPPPQPEEPRRIERVWREVMRRRDAAWQPVCDARAWHRERVERVERCEAALTDRDVELLTGRGTIERTEALDAVQSWERALRASSGTPRVLVLLGASGVGKTLACASWATSARPETEGVVTHMRELSAHATASYGEPDHRFAELVRTPMLVVDELGWERTEASRAKGADVLFDLLRARSRSPYATVLVSNRPKRDEREGRGFLDHYTRIGTDREHTPLLDRLRADTIVVELGGESLRPGEL